MSDKIDLELYTGDVRVAHVRLSGKEETPPAGAERRVSLGVLLPGYDGPEVQLKFDENEKLTGVEILRSNEGLKQE